MTSLEGSEVPPASWHDDEDTLDRGASQQGSRCFELPQTTDEKWQKQITRMSEQLVRLWEALDKERRDRQVDVAAMRLQSMESPADYSSHILSPLVEEWGEDGDSPEQTQNVAALPPATSSSSSSYSGRVRPMLIRPPPPLPTAPATTASSGDGDDDGGGYYEAEKGLQQQHQQQQQQQQRGGHGGKHSENLYASPPPMGGPFFPSGVDVGRGGLASLGEECLSIRLDTLEVHIRARLQGLEEQLNSHSDCLKSFSQDFDSLQNLLGAVAKDAGLHPYREDANQIGSSKSEDGYLSQDEIREVLTKFSEHSEHLEKQVTDFLGARTDELQMVQLKMEETTKRLDGSLQSLEDRLQRASSRLEVVAAKVSTMETSVADIGTALLNPTNAEIAQSSHRGESETSNRTAAPDQQQEGHLASGPGRKSQNPPSQPVQRPAQTRQPSPTSQYLPQRQPPPQTWQQQQQQQQQQQLQQQFQYQQQQQQHVAGLVPAPRPPVVQQVVVPSPPMQHRTLIVEGTPSRSRSNERTRSPVLPHHPTVVVGQTYLGTPCAKTALSAVPVQEGWTWTPELRSRSPLSVSTPVLAARTTSNCPVPSSVNLGQGSLVSNASMAGASGSATAAAPATASAAVSAGTTSTAATLPPTTVPMAPVVLSPAASATIPTVAAPPAVPAMSAVPRSAYGPPVTADPLTGSARAYQARQPPLQGGSIVMRSYSGPSLFKLPLGASSTAASASSSVSMRPAVGHSPPASGTPLASPYLATRNLSREQTMNSIGSTSPTQAYRGAGEVAHKMK